MSVIYCTAPQGSDQWFADRAGAITASMATECRKVVGGLDERQSRYVDLVRSGIDEKQAANDAGYKSKPSSDIIRRAISGENVGDYSDKAKDYAFKLAVERISGRLLDEPQFDTWQARRGREEEPNARLSYEEKTANWVEEVSFARTEDGKFGASLDGKVGDVGSLEIKCFLASAKVRDILFSRDLSDYKDQIQMGLWITGKQWCDFVFYAPYLASIRKETTIIRVERDNEYIEAMQADLLAFDKYVCEIEAKLRAL